jgi:hypothetical protein
MMQGAEGAEGARHLVAKEVHSLELLDVPQTKGLVPALWEDVLHKHPGTLGHW